MIEKWASGPEGDSSKKPKSHHLSNVYKRYDKVKKILYRAKTKTANTTDKSRMISHSIFSIFNAYIEYGI